jgi:hypothetical protein
MAKTIDKTATVRLTRVAEAPRTFSSVEQECLDRLNAIGFYRPVDLLLKYDSGRVKAAIDYVESQKPGQLKNPAGFIKVLVMSSAPIPTPPVKRDKFKKQKYANIFCYGLCSRCEHRGIYRICERKEE